ncbi:MAG: arsenite methyltransferase [Bacteroidia bacterium]|nr:arsenite methyltransferase [Bacteroidia bacterium]
MDTPENLKELVREKYSQIALQDRTTNATSCCGATGCGEPVYNIMAEDYATESGYVPEADLGLGCGIPTQHAGIEPGMTVLDLGSGAGNDVFVARQLVGPNGKVLGVDFTPAMVAKARQNADTLGYNNVEFREGDIEHLPIGGGTIDTVVSNCVLNLVPNKAQAFAEIFRVLKPGGHFCISDIVLVGELPAAIRQAAEFYAGCVSGAQQEADYLAIVREAGFEGLEVRVRREIHIPDAILAEVLDGPALQAFRSSGTGIFSITLRATKPKACCGPDCC